MKLIFLGPPGVGKGTHAEEAGKHYFIPKISTGDLFRDEVKKRTKLGLKLNKYMKKGLLVPDDLVVEILKKRIEQADYKKGFILDGFPRTINQAKKLQNITHIDLVLNLTASKKTIIQRITNRLTCKKCGAIYNKISMPPKKGGVCDLCGGELYQREDQKEAIVQNRLEVYEKETKPLINYYKKKGLLVNVNVEGEKATVSERVFKVLAQRFSRYI